MRTILFALFLMGTIAAEAQKVPSYAEKMAATAMTLWKDSLSDTKGNPAKWAYDQGVVLRGIEELWHQTGNGVYFRYLQKSTDRFINDSGGIRTYNLKAYDLGNILGGRMLITLFQVTGRKKYYKAASTLRKQLLQQPRLSNGGFWHTEGCPYQMRLGDLYWEAPFFAQWATVFREDSVFKDIARQFIVLEQHARDPKTGLLYPVYDEDSNQNLAGKTRGGSPVFKGRSMGWYGMGLVDALEYFPTEYAQRKELIVLLNRFANAVVKWQDPDSGLWWNVLNFPGRKGNYVEASASSMFVDILLKGVRLGYLPSSFVASAKKGYAGILDHFVTTSDGRLNLAGTAGVSAQDMKSFRDRSYESEVKEKAVTNAPDGVGAFLLASHEMELLPSLQVGKGKMVVLDSYFNNEFHRDAAGINRSFHYKWEDQANSGFSFLGSIFRSYGATTRTLYEAPTLVNLQKASVYIIVDPDTKKESAHPEMITAESDDVLYNWVREGGVLVLMANDSANTELHHFNQLAQRFGIHWSDTSCNMVKGNLLEMGAVAIPAHHPIFPAVTKIYIKEACVLKVQPPAKASIINQGITMMGVAHVGKGTVFAVGDPWIYNEYVDGRNLPPEYENFPAAKSWVNWLLKQSQR